MLRCECWSGSGDWGKDMKPPKKPFRLVEPESDAEAHAQSVSWLQAHVRARAQDTFHDYAHLGSAHVDRLARSIVTHPDAYVSSADGLPSIKSHAQLANLVVKFSLANRLRHLARGLPKSVVCSVLEDAERLTVAAYEGLLGDDVHFDEVLTRRVLLPNRLGGIAMGASQCADAAYVAATTRMENFAVPSDFSSAPLSLLCEHIESRAANGPFRTMGFYESALRDSCDAINEAASADSVLIDKDPPKKKKNHDDAEDSAALPSDVGSVWQPPMPTASFALLYQAPLSQKELSAPLWNRYYNGAVLLARGITDKTIRDLHLTLLDEGSTRGAGVFVNSVPSNKFTRFSSPEFCVVLRNFLGLSTAGDDGAESSHVHFCGKNRDKRHILKNCKAMATGKAALADSTAHLAHCALEGQLHARHAALEATLLAMIQAADFGWGWRREVTLCTPGDGNPNVPKTWKSDLVGHDNMGRKCVINTTVVTLAAPSYRGARNTLRSRCLRTLAEAVKNKLKLPRAAARAKDLQARHTVFCISSNGAFSAMAQDFFDEVKDHARKQGLDHMGVSLIERHSVSFTTRFWNTFFGPNA